MREFDMINMLSAYFAEHEVIDYNKQIILSDDKSDYNHIYRPDMFVETGCEALNINKPLCIEFKSFLNYSIYNRLRALYASLSLKYGYALIVVYANTDLAFSSEDGPFLLISLEAITKLLEPLSKFVHKLSDKIVKVEPANQEDVINKAKDALTNTRSSFILGAGVSVEAGSATWSDLLKGLLSNGTHRPIDVNDYDAINTSCGCSPLISARYILGNLSNDEIVKSIRKSLYDKNFSAPNKGTIKSGSTLDIIAGIIESSRTIGLTIESVLTFNYDIFMELALKKYDVAFESIYDKHILTDKLPIYHIHGIIDRPGKPNDAVPVLSESSYHEMYADAFHWANVELLHALTRNSCFFVGLSMTDPNLRRLLDIAKRNKDDEPSHFIFMRQEPLSSQAQPDKNEKHWLNLEKEYREMGINIIWYKYDKSNPSDHNDLKVKLQSLAELMNEHNAPSAVKPQ